MYNSYFTPECITVYKIPHKQPGVQRPAAVVVVAVAVAVEATIALTRAVAPLHATRITVAMIRAVVPVDEARRAVAIAPLLAVAVVVDEAVAVVAATDLRKTDIKTTHKPKLIKELQS